MFNLIFFLSILIPQGDVGGYFFKEGTPVLSHTKSIEGHRHPSGLPFVDCIYVINLDQRKEKWQRMENLMKMHSLNPTRVSAINGWELSKKKEKELFGPYPVKLTGGEIGCLLSHLSVMKDAVDKGFSLIWLCEDDIDIKEDPAILSELIADLFSLDPDWDLFFTDPNTRNPKGEIVESLDLCVRPNQPHYPIEFYRTRHAINKDFESIGQRFGMYSVLISAKGLKKILAYYNHVYLWSQIDVDIHYIPHIRTYTAKREIVTVNWECPISDTINHAPN